MKLQNLVLTGALVLACSATLAAKSSLPNAHDDSCWASLSALRACQIQAQHQAQEDAQSCTSYPEYECFDYYQPQQTTPKTATKSAKRRRAREAGEATEKEARP